MAIGMTNAIAAAGGGIIDQYDREYIPVVKPTGFSLKAYSERGYLTLTNNVFRKPIVTDTYIIYMDNRTYESSREYPKVLNRITLATGAHTTLTMPQDIHHIEDFDTTYFLAFSESATVLYKINKSTFTVSQTSPAWSGYFGAFSSRAIASDGTKIYALLNWSAQSKYILQEINASTFAIVAGSYFYISASYIQMGVVTCGATDDFVRVFVFSGSTNPPSFYALSKSNITTPAYSGGLPAQANAGSPTSIECFFIHAGKAYIGFGQYAIYSFSLTVANSAVTIVGSIATAAPNNRGYITTVKLGSILMHVCGETVAGAGHTVFYFSRPDEHDVFPYIGSYTFSFASSGSLITPYIVLDPSYSGYNMLIDMGVAPCRRMELKHDIVYLVPKEV